MLLGTNYAQHYAGTIRAPLHHRLERKTEHEPHLKSMNLTKILIGPAFCITQYTTSSARVSTTHVQIWRVFTLYVALLRS